MNQMEMVTGEDVERSKMDHETYIKHVIACVDAFLEGTKRKFLQRSGSATNPFTLAMVEHEHEVNALVRKNVINRRLQTVPGSINPFITNTTEDGFKDGLLDHTVRLNKAKMGQGVHGLRPRQHDAEVIMGQSFTGGREATLGSGRITIRLHTV
jgi:hypothetical protein